MRKLAYLFVLTSLVMVGCGKAGDTASSSSSVEVKKVVVKNDPVVESTAVAESTSEEVEGEVAITPNELTYDQHEYTYDVVTGATQTTFGSNPPPKYSKEEKLSKMFWSNQPPLGLLEGYYYRNEGLFDGGNKGILEIVTSKEDAKILNVEFTEFAKDPYYEGRYSGVNKRLSDYAFFQADNPRTDDTLATVVNGITFLEKQMRDENRVTGNFDTVNGSSTSARRGFMPLAAAMDEWIRKPYESEYKGYSKELENGLIGRLQIITTDGKITAATYDEYFADMPEKMSDEALKPYYRQSKYYSLSYNQATNNDFVNFADKLTKNIVDKQSLLMDDAELKENPAYAAYEQVAKQMNIN